MLLTIKCMGVAFLAGYLIGVPLVWLARRGKALSPTDWLYAPLVGLSGATVVAHQLAFLDVRLTVSAPVIWGFTALLWVVLGLRCGWKTPFENCPWPVLAATLAVYLVQCLGLLAVGPDLFVGRYHSDRFNYICVAQYLIDVPFSAHWEGIGQRAYLADGVKLVQVERIGVQVLQGFLAVSAKDSADRMFEPLILLAPALLVPALVLIGRALNFSWPHATLAGAAGGLLPGLATLHTQCFLANVVGIPFAFASAAAACQAVVSPSWRRVGVTGVVFAGAACTYTEFVPVLVAIGAGAAFFAILLRRSRWYAAVGGVLAAGLVAFAIFPKSPHAGHLETIFRTAGQTQKDHPVAWVQGKQTVGAVWVYDVWSIDPPLSRQRIVLGIGAALTLISLVGLVRLGYGALASRRLPPGEPDASGVMGLVVICLAVGPLVAFYDGKHDYQAMKLLLSFCPAWVIGVAAALRPRAAGAEAGTVGAGFWPRAALAGLVIPVLVCGYGTGALMYNLAQDKVVPKSHHTIAHNKQLNQLKHVLRSIPRTDVVLGVGPGFVENGEVSFAARRHRVWLACVQINDRHALGCVRPDDSLRSLREGRHLVDLTTVPQEALVVTVNGPNAPLRIEGDKHLDREIGPYQLWRVGPGPYKLIAGERAARPPELDHPSPTKMDVQ